MDEESSRHGRRIQHEVELQEYYLFDEARMVEIGCCVECVEFVEVVDFAWERRIVVRLRKAWSGLTLHELLTKRLL